MHSTVTTLKNVPFERCISVGELQRNSQSQSKRKRSAASGVSISKTTKAELSQSQEPRTLSISPHGRQRHNRLDHLSLLFQAIIAGSCVMCCTITPVPSNVLFKNSLGKWNCSVLITHTKNS